MSLSGRTVKLTMVAVDLRSPLPSKAVLALGAQAFIDARVYTSLFK
jgi:hypothetical protein